MRWRFTSALQTFAAHRNVWDAINRDQGDHVLLDSAFVHLLIRNFGTAGTVLALSDDQECPSMVLVEQRRFGRWETFQPSQAPLGLILLGRYIDPWVQIHRLTRDLPGYALLFAVLHQDSEHTQFGSMVPTPSRRG